MATLTAVDSETGIEAGALDMTSLPKEVKEFYRQIIQWGMVAPASVRDEYRRLLEAGSVHALLADDPSLNGWAVKRNNEFRFGLHAATPVIVHFTCNQLMRTGEIFPELGDPHEDDPPIKHYTHGIPIRLPDELPLTEACTVLPSVSRPKCDIRSAAASALTELVCAFGMFHEVAHVIAGHVGHYAEVSPISLLELDGLRRSPLPRKLQRVWEYEADKIASVMLLSFVADPANREHLADVFGIPDSEDILALAAVALMASTVLFLLFGQRISSLGGACAHPHPLVRTTYIHNAIRVCATGDLEFDESSFDAACDPATRSVYSGWNALGASVPAVMRWTFFSTSWLVQRQIEQLETDQRRFQSRYIEHSWIPENAWRD